MAGDNRLVTENFLRLNFTPKSGITAGTNDLIAMSCDQIKTRYLVSISGITSTGTRLPSQNQLTVITAPTQSECTFPAYNSTSVTVQTNVGNGGGTLSARGVCYAVTANPTTANYKAVMTNTTGVQQKVITRPVIGQAYYFRSYATNEAGTTYYGPSFSI
jgi:hypothetical protein